MSEVSLLSAFLAGLLSFAAPCTLPLIPAYLAFLAGTESPEKHVVFRRALSFIIGFSGLVILLGIFVAQLGRFVTAYRGLLVMGGGVLFVLFGVSLLGIVRIPLRAKGLPAAMNPQGVFAPFLLGIVFAFGWSPCVGPILGSIYVLVAGSGSFSFGLFLLLAFVVGHGLPFLLFAYFYEKSFQMVTWLNKYTSIINKSAGVFLVVIGLFMLIGKYGYVLSFFSHIVDGEWQQRLMDYM